MSPIKITEIKGRTTDSSGNISTNDINLSGALTQSIGSLSSFNIDCSTGNYFTKTVSGNSTFSVSNVPSNKSYSFTLVVTHTGGTIGWFSGVKWSEDTAPTLSTNKKHVFMFLTNDGGSSWFGAVLPNYTN